MSHAIGGDGIHANHNQRKRPTLATPEINQHIEPGHQEEAPTTAEKNPARSPDALHDRTNPQPAKRRTRTESNDASSGQPFYLGPGRAIAANQITSQQTKDHRAQRRDEAQRAIATLVMGERMFAWEKIQEPGVKRPRKVCVLIPMG